MQSSAIVPQVVTLLASSITLDVVLVGLDTVSVSVGSDGLEYFLYDLVTQGRKILGPEAENATQVDIISPGFTPGPMPLDWWETRGRIFLQWDRAVQLAAAELDEEDYE